MNAPDLKPLHELDLNVRRWGNSLAVRLPVELVRQLGIAQGSTLHVARNSDNTLTVSPQIAKTPFDPAQWQALANQHLGSMPPSPPVMHALRGAARY
jgi:antitoxin MazE